MTPRRLAPVVAAALPMGGAPDAASGPDIAQSASDFIHAQQAVGVPVEESFAMAAALYGCEAVRPAWDAFLAAGPDGGVAVDVLRGIATVDPVAANAWLSAGLASRAIREWEDDLWHEGINLSNCKWVTSLPDGLKVVGTFGLGDCVALQNLPEGLQVSGALILAGCSSLEGLPRGLDVGRSLVLDAGCSAMRTIAPGLKVGTWMKFTGCAAWDGRMPDDAEIRDLFYTDRHPEGTSLHRWRALYPHGEGSHEEAGDIRQDGGA